MTDSKSRVESLYAFLHGIPEIGLAEHQTSAFLAQQLRAAGYEVQTGIGGTGVIGILRGETPGPTFALRADMDALQHIVNGKECAIHSCGHDAHSAMVLCAAEQIAEKKLSSGSLKIIFQPAEETLVGAVGMIEAGAIADVDMIIGIHLRPGQEAKLGQATPALYHGSSYIMEAAIEGVASHGARPHLGVNAIDAAAAVVQAINAIHMNPVVPSSIKVTKLHAGGAALNAIPDKADLAMDLRSQDNDLMDELIKKAQRAIENAAASVGANASVSVKGGVPAAEYSADMVELAREAITQVLGEQGLLAPITTPGGEDFHFYIKHKPTLKAGYIGLGCDLSPGLHHPGMKFDTAALINGVDILLYIVRKSLGFKG